MNEWGITILAALVLSAIHLIAPRFKKFLRGRHVQLMSLSAGMFLSYIFLEGLDNIIEAHANLGKIILVYFFAGFALYHVFNKYLYQHAKNEQEAKKEADELVYAGAIIDALFTGFALAILLDLSQPAYFALIPFMLHTFSATLTVQLHHEHFKTPAILRYLLSFAPLIGAIIGLVLLVETNAFYSLLAFVTGAVLYIAVRHMLPGGKEGNIWYFLLGGAIGIILLLL